MRSPLLRIRIGGFVLALVFATAVIGYHFLGGYDWVDAIYMVVITIFGVGYGEVQPIQSPGLRALTIMVIVTGYAALIYTAGGLMQMLIDGELNRALGARKMTKEIAKLSGHTIVCGVGRMGAILARELNTEQKPSVVIDLDEQRISSAIENGYLVLRGDATDEQVLEQAGVRQAATLATVLSDDATNVFVTITARALNSELHIIARGENPRTESKLLGCGANQVVLPTAIGANRVAQLIIRPSAEEVLQKFSLERHANEDLKQIGLRFDQLEVADGAALVGKPLGSIEIRSNHGFRVVGIRSRQGQTLMNPPGDTVLNAGDVVIVLGHHDDIPQLAERFVDAAPKITYRGVST